jgi:predicted permease
MLLGYVCKATKFMPESVETGLGRFLATLGLPCVLFRALSTVDLEKIDAKILGSAVLAKLVVFPAAFALGRLIARRQRHRTSGLQPYTPGRGINLGALCALYCTQSDDVGIGYPIFSVIFRDSPALLSTLYLLSSLQALTLNPLAYVLLGLGQQKTAASERDSEPPSTRAILLSVLRAMRKNPLVLAVLAGLVWNLCATAASGASGSALPWFIDDGTALIARTFTPLVLFISGSWSFGALDALSTPKIAATAGTFVILKSFALPLLMRALLRSQITRQTCVGSQIKSQTCNQGTRPTSLTWQVRSSARSAPTPSPPTSPSSTVCCLRPRRSWSSPRATAFMGRRSPCSLAPC